MIYSTNQLRDKYQNYKNSGAKIGLEVTKGNLIRLKRDLYTDSLTEKKEVVANALYRPSYLSFDYALAYYGLIPERVYSLTSAITEKHKNKQYDNKFGTFTYQNIPSSVFPYGIITLNESYQIASKEKALADKLYSLPPATSLKELKKLLFEWLRLDEDGFACLSQDDLRFLLPKYKCQNCSLLLKMIGEKE